MTQILSYEQLKENVSNNVQDVFTSACAYFYVEKIINSLKEKIIPELQHFYVLITAYVGVKQRIDNNKEKYRRDNYSYFAATGTGLNYNWKNSISMSYKDFHFKYMVDELFHIIKLFVMNGFICDKNVFKVLIFLNIDLDPIEHLFNLTDKEKQEIRLKYDNVYNQYIEETHKTKQKINEKEQKTKTQIVFEKLCRYHTLDTILECKRLGKKLTYSQTCIKSSLYNHHTEVFEFFNSNGYIPTLDDINLISKMDRRFILLLRFYPNVFDDKNNYDEIEKQLEKSHKIYEQNHTEEHYSIDHQNTYTLCDMYVPSSGKTSSKTHLERYGIGKQNDANDIVLSFDKNDTDEFENDFDSEDDEVLVKKKK